MRKLNLVFLASILVSVAVLSVATYFLHEYQVKRNASALLDVARKAETDGKPAKAAEALSHYLSLNRKDGKTYKWYAQTAGRGCTRKSRDVGVSFWTFTRKPSASIRTINSSYATAPTWRWPLVRDRINDARTHLTALLDEYDKDSTDPGKAELEELLGDCSIRETKFQEAKLAMIMRPRSIRHASPLT